MNQRGLLIRVGGLGAFVLAELIGCGVPREDTEFPQARQAQNSQTQSPVSSTEASSPPSNIPVQTLTARDGTVSRPSCCDCDQGFQYCLELHAAMEDVLAECRAEWAWCFKNCLYPRGGYCE